MPQNNTILFKFFKFLRYFPNYYYYYYFLTSHFSTDGSITKQLGRGWRGHDSLLLKCLWKRSVVLLLSISSRGFFPVFCFTSKWLLLLLITHVCFSPYTASFNLQTSLATGSCWTLWTKKIRSLASLLTWRSPTATIKSRYWTLNSLVCNLTAHFQRTKANAALFLCSLRRV